MINTDIYDCSESVFTLGEATTGAVFDRCRFYGNRGYNLFYFSSGVDILVKDTEIYDNLGNLMPGDDESEADMDGGHITFQNCTFQNNRWMDTDPDSWPDATFEDCHFPLVSVSDPTSTPYDELIERFRALAADPDSFPTADGAGEQNFLVTVQEMAEGWGYDPLDMIGYAIQDLNGDGVPELAIGPMREYGVYQIALFTLVDGEPWLVFGDEGDGSYAYLQDGRFFYYGYRSASETGQGIYHLTDDGTTLICEEFYFVHILDGDESDVTVYYNTTGSWDIEDSQKTDMSLEEFWAWEPEYEYLSMTPFSTENAGVR